MFHHHIFNKNASIKHIITEVGDIIISKVDLPMKPIIISKVDLPMKPLLQA